MLPTTILSFFATSIVYVTLAAAFPPHIDNVKIDEIDKRASCTVIDVRKEWRNLTSAEQIAYLNAEICLMNLPAETGLAAVTSRYSDLASLHQNLTLIIHEVGQFLPWHRYFVHVHEEILKSQCNYDGPIP